MTSTQPSRPSAPDPSILERAAAALVRLYQLDGYGQVHWEVGARMDRPRSTLFPLLADVAGAEPITVFYKVMLPSSRGEEGRHEMRIERARSGLSVAMELEDRLATQVADEPIAFSRALVVDPNTLTTVTLGVPGEPFGSVTRHLLTPSRLRSAVAWLEMTGRAARLIEECTVGVVMDREDERADLMDRRLDRIERSSAPKWLDRLRDRVDEIYRGCLASDQPITYAHGDFSPTNLLVGDGIGLIDFEWVPRLRVFDLANLVFRLEYETALPPRMLRPMIRAVIIGYDSPDVVDSTFWEYHRVSALLKVARPGYLPRRDKRSNRVRRAFDELERLAAGQTDQ